MASSHPDVSRPGRRRQSPGLSLAAVALVTFATLRVADRIQAGSPACPATSARTGRWPTPSGPRVAVSASPSTFRTRCAGLQPRFARRRRRPPSRWCSTGWTDGPRAWWSARRARRAVAAHRRWSKRSRSWSAARSNLAGRPAELRRVLDPSGRQVTEIAWASGNRRRLLRFEGPVDQALLMAQSIERSRR